MDKPTTTIPACVVLINGFPSVGKLTTARALCSLLPPKSTHLLDNHMWLDPAYAASKNRSSPKYAADCLSLRSLMFSQLTEIDNNDASIIMTNVIVMEAPADIEAFAGHVKIARVRGIPFVLVNLTCDESENKDRMVKRDTGAKSKLQKPEVLGEMLKKWTLLDPASEIVRDLVDGLEFRVLELNTTSLEVEGSVRRILEFLQKE